MKIATSLLVLVISIAALPSYAQKCPQLGVFYVVRGEDGKPLNDAELKLVLDRLPKTIGTADPTTATGAVMPSISSAGVNVDGSLRPYSYEAPPIRTVAALALFSTDCRLRLDQLTVDLGGKRMRLLFNLEFGPDGVRVPVVDSPPFQEGSFALDPPRVQGVVPARQWRKVSDKP